MSKVEGNMSRVHIFTKCTLEAGYNMLPENNIGRKYSTMIQIFVKDDRGDCVALGKDVPFDFKWVLPRLDPKYFMYPFQIL